MTRRIAKVPIDLTFLSMCLRGDTVGLKKELITDAPDDLQVIDIEHGTAGALPGVRTAIALVESNSFEEVEEGANPPVLPAFTYEVKRISHANRQS